MQQVQEFQSAYSHFTNESRNLSDLTHENITKVLEIGEGKLYFPQYIPLSADGTLTNE